MTKQCKCGRPVTAGYTAGGTGTDWCLICETEVLMRTFCDPMTIKHKKRIGAMTHRAERRGDTQGEL